MDNSLKKLKRVQLLELLAEQAEDKEALAAENRELHERLRRQPSLASTSAKIGSIAEAALQVNGYFESAQQAADEYLREILQMRNQLAARLERQDELIAARAQALAAEQVQQIQQARQEHVQASAPGPDQLSPLGFQAGQMDDGLHDARMTAEGIIARANARAQTIVADALAKSDQIIEDANRQAHAIVSRANRQADALVESTRSQAQSSSRAAARSSARSSTGGTNRSGQQSRRRAGGGVS